VGGPVVGGDEVGEDLDARHQREQPDVPAEGDGQELPGERGELERGQVQATPEDHRPDEQPQEEQDRRGGGAEDARGEPWPSVDHDACGHAQPDGDERPLPGPAERGHAIGHERHEGRNAHEERERAFDQRDARAHLACPGAELLLAEAAPAAAVGHPLHHPPVHQRDDRHGHHDEPDRRPEAGRAAAAHGEQLQERSEHVQRRRGRITAPRQRALERALESMRNCCAQARHLGFQRCVRKDAAAVRGAVAQNPNTPPEALDSLAAQCTTEVATNPALPLMALVDPAMPWLSLSSASALVACADTPGVVVTVIARRAPRSFRYKTPSWAQCGTAAHHAWVTSVAAWWQAIAANPHCPADVLEPLAACECVELRARAARNPSTPAAWRALLVRAGSTSLLRGLTRPAPLLPEQRAALSNAGHWGRVLVARSPSTPHAERVALVALATAEAYLREGCPYDEEQGYHARHELLAALASNPCALVGELEALAALRASVAWIARSQATPPLLELALASHRSTPPALLADLSCSLFTAVRKKVLSHPNLDRGWIALLIAAGASADLSTFTPPAEALPPGSLARLLEGGPFARLLVANHPLSSPTFLIPLLSDDEDEVREAAARNPALGASEALRVAREGAPELRSMLASAGWLPVEAFVILAADKEVRVRFALARNPALPGEAIEIISRDENEYVRADLSRMLAERSGKRDVSVGEQSPPPRLRPLSAAVRRSSRRRGRAPG
jgi:hypothetical protein